MQPHRKGLKMKKYSLAGFRPAPITEKEAVATRRHQGIPGIERLDSGRLFATWYGGELNGEGPGNYLVLATSRDNGLSWREIQIVAPDGAEERAFDPTLWLDPDGRLWWSWSQCVTTGIWDIFDGRSGVWVAVCDDPDTDSPVWSAPRRIAEGVMMNKPTALSDGSWAFPTALWGIYPDKLDPQYTAIARSNISVTRDKGQTFELIVGPDIPNRGFDEHILLEQRDGVWRILVRTHYGIGQAFSDDCGRTWRDIGDSRLGGPDSRFALRRLKSGKLLLINHQTPIPLPGETPAFQREKLTAWLSSDDGASWHGRLLLDERPGVSYPDFTEGNDGFLYCVYDRNRCGRGEILLARFTEQDVEAGEFITPGGFQRGLISAFPIKK